MSNDKSTKSYIHSLLDALILRVIQTGEMRQQIYVIPFSELAQEYKHYESPLETDGLDIHVQISVKIGDEDESFDTSKDFAIENKVRH